MCAIIRATESPAAGRVPAAAYCPSWKSGSHRIAVRATAEKAMFCADSSEDAATRIARSTCVGGVDRPLQDLHPAEGAADGGVQPVDPEVAAAGGGGP